MFLIKYICSESSLSRQYFLQRRITICATKINGIITKKELFSVLQLPLLESYKNCFKLAPNMLIEI